MMKRLMLMVMAGLGLAQAQVVEPFEAYRQQGSQRLVPLLQEAVRFPTVAGNRDAFAAQKTWLMKIASEMGFQVRESEGVIEVTLPAPEGGALLGLAAHSDVVPVDPSKWSFAPFSGAVQGGYILGRGTADDKGAIVQALLSMKAIADSGIPRRHGIRLLIGSAEETGSEDMQAYVKANPAPACTLVLDAFFPVTFGEKASNTLRIVSDALAQPAGGLRVAAVRGGLFPSIVPDDAAVEIEGDVQALAQFRKKLHRTPTGTRLVVRREGRRMTLGVLGKASHSGMNLGGGRNAVYGLAMAVKDLLPGGQAAELLAFARMAGRDLHGAGLGLDSKAWAAWGGYGVNVAELRVLEDGRFELAVNIRRPPEMGKEAMRAHLDGVIAHFNLEHGAHLRATAFSGNEPKVYGQAPIIPRLAELYREATGKATAPVVMGGGTYAKYLPNAIAFGMWFADKPYPGHGADEKVLIADLHQGVKVLVHALATLVTSPDLPASRDFDGTREAGME